MAADAAAGQRTARRVAEQAQPPWRACAEFVLSLGI